jgi:hypothetical protein
MPSPKCVVVCLLIAAFAFPCVAAGPAAVENPTIPSEAITFVAEHGIKQLAGMGYNINCRAKNLDYKSDDSLICGLFGSFSGEAEKEWKDRLVHRLEGIDKKVTAINNALAQVQQKQETLLNLNKQILIRMNEIGTETIVGKDLSRIRVDWKNFYTPMMAKDKFTKERALNFARQVVFEDKVGQALDEINDQLTHNQFGNDTLLRSYARRILQGGSKNLEPPYAYIEAVMKDLITEQRRGFVMYEWAAKTLETNCQFGGDCADFNKLPHNASDYRDIFARNMDEQLAEFNSAIEFAVLATSDTHNRSAYILPEQGINILTRADFFTSAMLEKGYGVRGRVIAMGDAGFDGKLAINGSQSLEPSSMLTSPPAFPGRVDYWRATTTPGVYDEIRLGDRWKIYHYHETGRFASHAGTVHISTSLPYKPQEVKIREVTFNDNSKVFFGSFTAIERAGGGYALLSGTGYDHSRSTPGETINGALHNKVDHGYFDSNAVYAGIRYEGRLEWEVSRGVMGEDQHIEAKRTSFAVSKKEIRYPAGGQLTLGVSLGDSLNVVCPHRGCADFSPYDVVHRWSDFGKSGFGSRDARMDTRAAVVLGKDEKSNNGIVWRRDSVFGSKISERVEIRADSGAVTLEANQPYRLIFGGETDLNIQTSGPGSTTFQTTAVVVLENAYLGE